MSRVNDDILFSEIQTEEALSRYQEEQYHCFRLSTGSQLNE